MLNYKNFKQIILILVLNLIVLFKIKPMAEPVSQKFNIGVTSQRGPRRTMEDEYQIIDNWGNTGITYVAIFDGHGGKRVAEYLKKNLHKIIFQNLLETNDLKLAIIQGCAQINQAILKAQQTKMNPSAGSRCRQTSFSTTGSCAIIAFIFENKVIIANIGDSRAVVSENGVSIQLSTDHKPNNESEKKRIEDAGGKVWISDDGKISKLCCAFGLAVARAFGNLAYKDLIISDPQIVGYNFLGDDVLILACDGLWDVMQNQEVVDVVTECKGMQEASEALANEAIRNRHTNDNVTIITIKPSDPNLWVHYTRKP